MKYLIEQESRGIHHAYLDHDHRVFIKDDKFSVYKYGVFLKFETAGVNAFVNESLKTMLAYELGRLVGYTFQPRAWICVTTENDSMKQITGPRMEKTYEYLEPDDTLIPGRIKLIYERELNLWGLDYITTKGYQELIEFFGKPFELLDIFRLFAYHLSDSYRFEQTVFHNGELHLVDTNWAFDFTYTSVSEYLNLRRNVLTPDQLGLMERIIELPEEQIIEIIDTISLELKDFFRKHPNVRVDFDWSKKDILEKMSFRMSMFTKVLNPKHGS